MKTLKIEYFNGIYEIQYTGLAIFYILHNHAPITFADCPDEVQEQIVKFLNDAVVRGSDNPYEDF